MRQLLATALDGGGRAKWWRTKKMLVVGREGEGRRKHNGTKLRT